MPRIVCLVPLAFGAVFYALFGHPTLPILELQFAGDAADAAEVIAGRTDEFRDALRADWMAFIPGMLLTLALASWRFANRRLAIAGVLFAVAYAVCDVIENAALWQGMNEGTDRAFELGTLFATIKYAMLLPAVGLAVWALVNPVQSDSPAESPVETSA